MTRLPLGFDQGLLLVGREGPPTQIERSWALEVIGREALRSPAPSEAEIAAVVMP